MKALNQYINEKFQVSKDNIRTYKYHPETKEELIKAIQDKIEKEGLGTKDKPLNLNDIDTSNITDMSYLFDTDDGKLQKLSDNGYFDISDWDVSNVKNMVSMFANSHFDGDISEWDVSKVKDMGAMFYFSYFNGNISNWDVSNVENMSSMFIYSHFMGDISEWNVRKVKNMNAMFRACPIDNDPPKWYKE